MVAGLVEGDDMILNDITHNKTITIKAGMETYIPPGIAFYLSATSKKEINLVLFELK
jgi:mannose-6-phosphate isomerase-like protein (cupin superfamily)